MVRGAAALLGAPAAALAYFLVAPTLPGLPAGDTSLVVAGGLGLALIAACALAPALAGAGPASAGVLAVGAGLLTGGLVAAGETAAADPLRGLAAGGVGVALASSLADRRAVLGVPLLVAVIDAWSVLGSGPASSLIAQQPSGLEYMVFDLPAWGHTPSGAGQLGMADMILMAVYAAWVVRLDLRRLSVGLLAACPLVALGLSVAVGRALPVLPLMAAALLAPNLVALSRTRGGGGVRRP